MGANCYTGNYIEAAPDTARGYREVTPAASHPVMGISWLRLEPDPLGVGREGKGTPSPSSSSSSSKGQG